MPTIQEIAYNVGQGYDNVYMWSSNKAPGHKKRWVGKGKKDNLAELDFEIVSEDSLHRTSAFFYVSKANMPVYYDNDSRIRTQMIKSD